MLEKLSASEGFRRTRGRLTARQIGGAIIVVLWAAIFGKHAENRALDYDDATRNLQNLSTLIEENTLRSIGELDITLRYLRNAIATAPEPKDYLSFASSAKGLSNIIVQVAVISEKGLMLASSAMPQQQTAIDLSDREHFLFHRNSGADVLFISKPVVGRASGKQSVQLTRPILRPDGTFGGVVVASFDPNHFNRVFEKVDLGDGASYALIGTDGVVRAVGGQPRHEHQLGSTFEAPRLVQQLANETSVTYWASDSQSQTIDLAVIRKISGQPLIASTRIPESTVFASSTYNLAAMSVAGLALSLITALATHWGRQFELEQKRKETQLRLSHEALSESNEKLTKLNDKLQQSEAEARRQHVLFESVFSNAPDGMIFTDNDRHIVNANAAMLNTFGYGLEELRGLPTRVLYQHEDEWRKVGQRIGQSGPLECEVVGVRKSGETFPCRLTLSELRDSTSTVIGQIGIVRDLTEEKRREAALLQKQNLEALGRLTGGIAHDFNNLLAVIGGNVELAGLADSEERRRSLLAEAEKAVQMGGTLNKRLITFARQRKLDRSSIDLNDLVKSMLPMIKLAVGERIAVLAAFSPSAPVHIDVSEMENALLNLATNARDAMARSGGTFRLETAFETIDAARAESLGVVAGEFVSLKATDTGEGMTAGVAARAIEPFFTTKEVGRGSGLGLTTIDGFIRQLGGFILIQSELGVGTTVSIYLPKSPFQVAALTVGDNVTRPTTATIQKVILVVEDNPHVRSVVCRQLEYLGYRVIEAHGGEAALGILRSGASVDLIFSDVVMPGALTGPELCREAAKYWPQIPTLLTSGFPMRSGVAAPSDQKMLQKPYTLAELGNAISSALNPQPGGAGDGSV